MLITRGAMMLLLGRFAVYQNFPPKYYFPSLAVRGTIEGWFETFQTFTSQLVAIPAPLMRVGGASVSTVLTLKHILCGAKGSDRDAMDGVRFVITAGMGLVVLQFRGFLFVGSVPHKTLKRQPMPRRLTWKTGHISKRY